MDNKMQRVDGAFIDQSRSTVRNAILLYLVVFVTLFCFTWISFALHCHGRCYFPLGDRVERFGDLLRFTGKFQYGSDPRRADSDHLLGTIFPSNYQALGVVLYLFLLQACAPYALAVFLAVFLAAIFLGCVAVWNRVRRLPGYTPLLGAAIFLSGLFGWGTLQVVMRGNLEGWAILPVMVGAWLLARRRYLAAGIMFGVAMAIKPYPLLWLLLLVRHRQWKAAAAGVLSFALATLGSLMIIDPNPVAAYRHIHGPSEFFAKYIAAFRPMEEMMFDHSLLQTMKTLVRIVRNRGLHFSRGEYGMNPNHPGALMLYHFSLFLVVPIGVMVLLRIWNKPMLNQIFAIATVSTLLAPIAGDYTLVVLLIPMAFFALMLVQDGATSKVPLTLSHMLWIVLPCSFLMSTVPLGVLHGVFETACLLVLLVAICHIELPSTLFGETDRLQELHGESMLPDPSARSRVLRVLLGTLSIHAEDLPLPCARLSSRRTSSSLVWSKTA